MKLQLKVTHWQMKLIVVVLLLATMLTFLHSKKKVFFTRNKWNEAMSHFDLRKIYFDHFTSPPPSTTSPTSTASTTLKPATPQCNYTYLSPENAEEGRRLLDSLAWPETPPMPTPFSLHSTTSSAKSSFSLEPRSGGWRVGDELTVRIQLRDYKGVPKKWGGDFLVSRLHNRLLGAAVVGQVQDHLNGTYTAVFPLLWTGEAGVQVILVHSSESITVLKRVTELQPQRLLFTSNFKSGSVQEKTKCNVCLDSSAGPVCNFTDLNTGEPWFCYKPENLSCNTRISHSSAGYDGKVSKEEATLFNKGVNLKAPIQAEGNATVTIQPKAEVSQEARPGPAGYYYNDQWRALRGPDVHPFNNASVISACLKGKRLHMFGDSTIRQFYQHLTAKVPNLLRFDKYSSSQTGPFLAADHDNDILVSYRCHSPPLRFAYVLVSQLRYVANELDGVAGGPHTVVVVGVWAHFTSYPFEVYYQRIMTVQRAVKRLLNRAPGTKVIIRSGNMKSLDLFQSVTASDWYVFQLDRLLRAVFKDMDVVLLDAWDMVLAHHLVHDLHPPPEIIKHMIDTILSSTCPEMFKKKVK